MELGELKKVMTLIELKDFKELTYLTEYITLETHGTRENVVKHTN